MCSTADGDSRADPAEHCLTRVGAATQALGCRVGPGLISCHWCAEARLRGYRGADAGTFSIDRSGVAATRGNTHRGAVFAGALGDAGKARIDGVTLATLKAWTAPLMRGLAWLGLSRWGRREYGLLAALGPASLLLGLLVADGVRLSGHVMPGVSVLGHSLEGYSEDALRAWWELENRRLASLRLTFTLADEQIEITLAELGVALDSEALSTATLAAGRGDSLIGWLQHRSSQALGAQIEVAPALEVDDARFDAVLANWQAKALTTPVEGGIQYEDDQLQPRWPKPGSLIDRAALLEALPELVKRGAGVHPIRTIETVPKLTREAVEQALARAKVVTGKRLTLELPQGLSPAEAEEADSRRSNQSKDAQPDRSQSARTLVFQPSLLRRALKTQISGEPARLTLSFDSETLKEYVDKHRASVEVEPQDAVFQIDHREQLTIVPSSAGTRVDAQLLPARLLELAEAGAERGELPMLTGVIPKLDTTQAKALNIKGLVASFTTKHPCCADRVKNIHRIADLMDGIVVRPGETFSVNETIGPRTQANGFFAAPTIVRGEIEDTIGGGVSQFATTLFNAVLRGGYEIIERQPHSYYFRRYPAGHEATLSFPKPDLIFRNDTKSGVLIKTEYGSTYIRVKLYGDNEGRKIAQHKGKRYNVVEPKIVYEANDELDPKDEKVKERGQPGWTIEVSRTITYADGETKTESRAVTYLPRERILEVHSCKIPEGEEGYTGEECPEPEPCDPADPECEGVACPPDDPECLERQREIRELVDAHSRPDSP